MAPNGILSLTVLLFACVFTANLDAGLLTYSFTGAGVDDRLKPIQSGGTPLQKVGSVQTLGDKGLQWNADYGVAQAGFTFSLGTQQSPTFRVDSVEMVFRFVQPAYGFMRVLDTSGGNSSHGLYVSGQRFVIERPSAPTLYSQYIDANNFIPVDRFLRLRIKQGADGSLSFWVDAYSTHTKSTVPIAFYYAQNGVTYDIGSTIPYTDALNFKNPMSLRFFLNNTTSYIGTSQITDLEIGSPQAVPEPSTLALFGLGLASFAASALRRRKKGVSPGS